MTNHIGALIIDLEGHVLTAEERELLQHPLVGGVILFARNYVSRNQVQQLCAAIRASRKAPLLIMVDQEGGRVQRFKEEFVLLPAMASFGKLYETESARALSLAEACGWLMAVEVLSVGVDISLAPVLDLDKGISSVIGDRAFHGNPDIVLHLANAFVAGMREAGMAATGKHFPGHGSVVFDTHKTLVQDTRSLKEIEQADILPFAGMIKNGMMALMAAHLVFPQIDANAVGYSRKWLQDILRHHLGFNGVIFSDDLSMEGANISANYVDRVVATREAGCDFALLCNERVGVIQVLDSLAADKHQLAEAKWGGLLAAMVEPQPYKNTERFQTIQRKLTF